MEGQGVNPGLPLTIHISAIVAKDNRIMDDDPQVYSLDSVSSSLVAESSDSVESLEAMAE